MTPTSACRTCIALGLAVSALVHGLAAGLVLRLGPPDIAQPPTPALALELAMFGPPEAPGEVPPAAGPPPRSEPADPSASEAAPEPVPEPVPEPMTQPAPVVRPQSVAQPLPKPRIQPPPKTKPKPKAAPRPERRPKPEQQPKPRPERKPKPIAPTPPRPALVESIEPPRAQRPPQTRPPAKAPGSTFSPRGTDNPDPAARSGAKASGGPSAVSAADRAAAERAYKSALQGAIARNQRFPEDARRRRATGAAIVSFVVQSDGRIGQIRVEKSSGDPVLDQAAIQTLSRLGRFNPIPPVIGRRSWPMRVPMRFNLR